MVMLSNMPPKPAAPTTEIQRRWDIQGLYRRLLASQFETDLQKELKQRLDKHRRAAWGKPVMSVNLMKSVCSQIGTALYDQTPQVTLKDGEDLLAALESAGLWSLMQGFGVDLVGIGDHAMRLDFDGGLTFRPIFGDYLIAWGHSRRPDVPHTVAELQLRRKPDTQAGAGEPYEWVYEILSIANPANPTHRIVLARDAFTPKAVDRTAAYLGEGDRSGDAYPYRYSDEEKTPFLPVVLYHRWRRAQMWCADANLELARGTLETCVLWTFWLHCVQDASWPQRAVAGLEPRFSVVKKPGQSSKDTDVVIESVPADPANIMVFDRALDADGDPGTAQGQFHQWEAAADPDTLEQAISRYTARLAEQLDIPASDIQRTSAGDARSGYAISISNEGLRRVQRRQEPQLRRGDLEVIRKAAAIANRATASTNSPTRYPESGATITYPAIPLSSEERDAMRRDIVEKLQQGLMSKVEAIQQLHGLTREQAIERLQQIQLDSLTFPVAAPTTPNLN